MSKILELLKSKVSYLQDILNITKKQSVAISDEDIEQLDLLTELKQSIINKINDIDRGIINLDKNFNINNNESMDLLKEIHALDVINNKMLDDKMKDVLKNITFLNTGKKGFAAYNGYSSMGGGYYIDQKR